MPKGNYPDTEKYIKLGIAGKSKNKWDAKGNLRPQRKSRAKDPERFKKRVEEKADVKEGYYSEGLLGKIIDSGVASGHLDENLRKYVNVPEEQEKEVDYYKNTKATNPYDPDEEPDLWSGWNKAKADRQRYFTPREFGGHHHDRLTPRRHTTVKTYTQTTIPEVKDIGAKETMTRFFNKQKHVGKEKFVIPASQRKALREHIKKHYKGEYKIGRDGVLALRTRERAGWGHVPEHQEKMEQFYKVRDFMKTVSQAPVDKNANLTLQQANIKMKIAEANKPVPPPPPSAELIKQTALARQENLLQKSLEPRMKKAKEWGRLYDDETIYDYDPLADFSDFRSQVPNPPQQGLREIGFGTNLYVTKRGGVPDLSGPWSAITQRKGIKDLGTAITSIKPNSLPTMGNPLPEVTTKEYLEQRTKKAEKTVKFKKKLKLKIKKKAEASSDIASSSVLDDDLPFPEVEPPKSINPKTKLNILGHSGKRWDKTWTPGYAKGYLKHLGAKGSRFLTLHEAKMEAFKHKGIRAITKQKFGRGKNRRTLYTIRGSGHITKQTKADEYTILLR